MPDSLHIVCPHCHSTNRVPRQRLGEGAKCGHCHQALFIGQPLNLDSASFERHISASDLPVLVDFWADWCGPCKMMAPVLAQTAAEMEPRLRIAKLDTEANPGPSSRFGIRSIPTLILFRRGKELDRISGALDRSSLLRWLQPHI